MMGKAQVFPAEAEWKQVPICPTAGEQALFDFLKQHLDSSYELFMQPHVNGDQPDLVLLRQGSGCVIFEVKDWNLECYQYRSGEPCWQVEDRAGNSGEKLSPFQQVKNYKDHLFEYHVEGLMAKKVLDPRIYGTVQCVVYFHNASEAQLKNFVGEAWGKETKYIAAWGKDSLHAGSLQRLLGKYSNRPSCFFNEEVYKKMRRVFAPAFHSSAAGREFVLDAKQRKLAISEAGKRTKVCGVAGGGKTLVLARRAVSAYKRTGKRVLILTYNITLRNYIHDRLSEVREDFSWTNFEIMNYHMLVQVYRNANGLRSLGINEEWVVREEEVRQQYDVILVDEVQDFEPAWIDTLHRLVKPDGELVFFGDEKQNIYQRQLDQEKKPYTKLGGQWNLLKKSHRLPSAVGSKAQAFFSEFLAKRYEAGEYEFVQNLFDEPPVIEAYQFPQIMPEELQEMILSFLEKRAVHDEDCCILSSKVESMRTLDAMLRRKGMRTSITFETYEEWKQLKQKFQVSDGDPRLKEACHKIRKSRKYHFWAGNGSVKLSTTHSFKGWEVHTLFLIIGGDGLADDPAEKASDELIYTALTRTRQNLIIISLGENKYNDFLRQHLGMQHLERCL